MYYVYLIQSLNPPEQKEEITATLRMAQPRTEQLQEGVSCEANSEVGR